MGQCEAGEPRRRKRRGQRMRAKVFEGPEYSLRVWVTSLLKLTDERIKMKLKTIELLQIL